jgi:hypothetical protein
MENPLPSGGEEAIWLFHVMVWRSPYATCGREREMRSVRQMCGYMSPGRIFRVKKKENA